MNRQVKDINKQIIGVIMNYEEKRKRSIEAAKKIDPSFDESKDIVITNEEFLAKVKNAEKGKCIVFDEAGIR